jgi:hypothetical protein
MIKNIIKNIVIYSIAAFVGGAVAGWFVRGHRDSKKAKMVLKQAA